MVVINTGVESSFARMEMAVVFPPDPTKAIFGVTERRRVFDSCILLIGIISIGGQEMGITDNDFKHAASNRHGFI